MATKKPTPDAKSAAMSDALTDEQTTAQVNTQASATEGEPSDVGAVETDAPASDYLTLFEPKTFPCCVRLTNNTPLSMPFPELRVSQPGGSAHLLLRGNTQVSSHPNTVEVEFADADQFKRFMADVAGFEELHGFKRAVKIEPVTKDEA